MATGLTGEHALRVLEFHSVLERIAAGATSPVGVERVRGLRPAPEREEAEERLRWAEEMAGFLLREDGWAPPPIPDARVTLRRLAAEEAVLSAEELAAIGALLDAARRVHRDLGRSGEGAPRLSALTRGLPREPDLAARLQRSFDEAGEVVDSASRELKRLRGELRNRRAALVERLERMAAAWPERLRVPDASVTLRNGRYCVPIRRDGQSQVGGIVHDESASRRTLFMEPPAAIGPMNEIRRLELAEAREVRRILAELTELVRPLAEPLKEGLERLATLDALYAGARYALAHGGSRPELQEGEGRGAYRVVEGRHPLLLASGETTVPFSLALTEQESVLLVSGPNSGGKTVLLKAIGLLSAMAQSGIVPPVGPGTRLPTFRAFFAVIGDEQSIEASLSTFSAQVRNLGEILVEADPRTLVLLDEIGSHTDPAEGGALAAVVLLRLASQAGLTVATTHLGELKALAEESERVVNASLRFDAERLRPTFLLCRDRPGRSYALEIAERLGLPAAVVESARERLGVEERSLDALLAELERREAELQARLAEGEARLERVRGREAEVGEREAVTDRRETELQRREREAEREARRRAERYLLEARRRVEETVQRLEERYEAASGRSPGARRAAVSAARSEMEDAVRAAREQIPPPPAVGPVPRGDVAEGGVVRVRSLDRVGRVREVRGERVVVEAGSLRLTVGAEDVEPVAGAATDRVLGESSGAAGAAGRMGGAGSGRYASLEPRFEVDLRGLRVAEVDSVLLSALDAALTGDLPWLRIIHGKGTGAVRQRVRELLKADGRIAVFRPGAYDEGGSGVTVVEFEVERDH
ncbi:MAG: endonuclease MutS2 [Gemmatimonadota bacterium]